MATEVRLPDLGEGIEDVTISRWLKAEGETVSAGDILLEVATDKVDTEVPAPAAGVLLKQHFVEGELVPVSAALALIGETGETVAESSAEEPAAPATPEPVENGTAPAATAAASDSPRATPVAQRIAHEQGIDLSQINGSGPGGKITKEDVLAFRPQEAPPTRALPGELAQVAPLPVYRLAAQHNIDLQELAGDRPLSALTRYDVLSAAASRSAGHKVTVAPRYQRPTSQPEVERQAAPKVAADQASSAAQAAAPQETRAAPKSAQAGTGEELVQLNRMRQLVARNTVQSAFAAPHVTTMWDLSMAAVLAHRAAHKDEFAQAGVKLTVTPYLIQAIVAALKAVPAANSSWSDAGVLIKRYYNIGMAVALPQDQYGIGGLIVPVIKRADELNLLGLARAVNDLAERARSNQLKVDELQGGTFTLSNYGVSGSRFQTPIIVQPQVGMLGVGAIEKRAVVVSQGHALEANSGDYLTFMPMTTLGFSYDHRVLDGATADAFCAVVKKTLESWR